MAVLSDRDARLVALRTAAVAVTRGGGPAVAVTAAAEALSAEPWGVVAGAGALARARWVVLDRDVVVGHELRARPPGHGEGPVWPAGAPVPLADRDGRRARGAYDTPPVIARSLVRAALEAAQGPVLSGLDPCCGPGALLVALQEAGVQQVHGGDLDPLAVAVARVAAPGADVVVADALDGGVEACVVVGNPPFVSPERQDRALRARLRASIPWLCGRFDLAVPLAAVSAARARRGGGVGLLVPASVLTEPYGEPLRRRWLQEHAVTALSSPERFPGASVSTALVALRVGAGPASVAPNGVPACEVLALPRAPLDPALRPGDAMIVAAVAASSVPLGALATVDTGLVAHGPGGGKARLIVDGPGPGVVPYADARELFEGRRRWLRYAPELMHRPKSPALFEGPKLVVQRLVGRASVRAMVDREGTYVGHTCTVVVLREPLVPLERLRELLVDPLLRGLLRTTHGARLDLYPHDVAGVPIPRVWFDAPRTSLARAWGLSGAQEARLRSLAAHGDPAR